MLKFQDTSILLILGVITFWVLSLQCMNKKGYQESLEPILGGIFEGFIIYPSSSLGDTSYQVLAKGNNIIYGIKELFKKNGKCSLDVKIVTLVTPKTLDRLFKIAGPQIKQLDLSGVSLTFLPSSISRLCFLDKLNLQNNKLKVLPSSIAQLGFLRTLNIQNNSLSTLPDSLGKLGFLQEFYMDGNSISRLPHSFGGLISLNALGIGRNNFKNFSRGVHKVSALQSVYIDGNKKNKIGSR